MQGALDVLDDLRYTLMLASGGEDARTHRLVDVEAACVAMHELARLHEVVLHNADKAYTLHLDTIRLAFALTTEQVDEDTQPQGMLSSRRWYMASWKYVHRARLRRQAEASAAYARELQAIAPQLEALKGAWAAFSFGEFLVTLYKAHPPKSGRAAPSAGCGTTKKRMVLEAIREYSPSNQAQHFPGGSVPRAWELLCQEVQKMLNRYYEENFKSGEAGLEAGGCAEVPTPRAEEAHRQHADGPGLRGARGRDACPEPASVARTLPF